MATVSIPCPKLPKIPSIPSIKLVGGAELRGFLDFSQGMGTDCTLTFSLLLQLSPLLASMACLLHILGAIKAAAGLAEVPPKVGDFLAALEKLAECFVMLTPPGIALTIKGILELIINFLSCLVSNLDSLLKIQLGIDVDAAAGNPVLQAQLECARNNAETAMGHLTASLSPLEPLVGMVSVVCGIAQLPIQLPDLTSLKQPKEISATIADLKAAVDGLKEAMAKVEEFIP